MRAQKSCRKQLSMSSTPTTPVSSAMARRALLADLISTAVFPLAITGSTALVPVVHRDLSASSQQAGWVVLAYNTVFAATLLGCGRIADRINRARFFALGNIVVATTGLASATATSAATLIVFRAVAGLGAAMCAAGGSSMIVAAFPPDQRPRVYRYSGVVLGGGLALGPLLSQVMIEAGSWRLVFAAPAILAVAAAFTALRLPDWPRDAAPVDVSGIVAFGALIATGCTALGLAGAVPMTGVFLAGALIVMAGFLFTRHQMRALHPALPLDLLRVREFRWYAAASGTFMGCLVSALALLPRLPVSGEQPVIATVALLLITVAPALLPLMVSPLTNRAPRQTVRFALMGCGGATALIAIAATGHASSPVCLVVGAFLLGVSLGLTQGVPDGQALTRVPATRGGSGAALFSTTRMSIETLVLAATTGAATVFGLAVSALVSGAACLLVLLPPKEEHDSE